MSKAFEISRQRTMVWVGGSDWLKPLSEVYVSSVSAIGVERDLHKPY